MTVIAMVPLLVCIIGLIVYALSSNSKVAELGRISFAFGLLVTLLVFATKVVKL
jgi:Na+/phosphate symporter